jgi:RNA polymerase sigma-70 factor, ECF subfamily
MTPPASGDTAGDQYWIDRVRQGDGAALEFLFRRYVRRVFGFAYALLRNREEAEEVVSDTFLRVFRFGGELRSGDGFESWLLRIARNLCIDRLRRPRLLTLPLEGIGAAALLAPNDQLDRTGLRLLVEQALDRVPEEQRAALVLRDIQGYSAREAAAVLDKTEPAFRSLHQRARKRLRDALQELEGENELP